MELSRPRPTLRSTYRLNYDVLSEIVSHLSLEEYKSIKDVLPGMEREVRYMDEPLRCSTGKQITDILSVYPNLKLRVEYTGKEEIPPEFGRVYEFF